VNLVGAIQFNLHLDNCRGGTADSTVLGAHNGFETWLHRACVPTLSDSRIEIVNYRIKIVLNSRCLERLVSVMCVRACAKLNLQVRETVGTNLNKVCEAGPCGCASFQSVCMYVQPLVILRRTRRRVYNNQSHIELRRRYIAYREFGVCVWCASQNL
jgi:hypothetical protein